MKALRWDRLGLVGLILVGCSSGMVALVGSSEAEEEAFTRLTHPKPVVALQKKEAFPVLLRNRTAQEEAEEATQDRCDPAASHNRAHLVARTCHAHERDILPCSVCKMTMRVPKNPYTAHQRAARSLPNSFFVENDVELGAGKRNGKLVEVEDRGERTHRHGCFLRRTSAARMGNHARHRKNPYTRDTNRLRRRNERDLPNSFFVRQAFVDRMDELAAAPRGKWSACSTATRMRASLRLRWKTASPDDLARHRRRSARPSV